MKAFSNLVLDVSYHHSFGEWTLAYMSASISFKCFGELQTCWPFLINKVPVLVKEFGPIDYIDFSPAEPHYFAVTCSVRVQIYNSITKLKQLMGDRSGLMCKLLCAGGEESHVKLFDVSSKSLLRVFKGHS
ncbi:unnamed protein product, partial [Timema podura]|nr:unnamed protein product [Timema podura]